MDLACIVALVNTNTPPFFVAHHSNKFSSPDQEDILCLACQLRLPVQLYRSFFDCMSCNMGSNVPMHVHLPSEDAYADDDSVIFDIASEEFSTDEFRMFDFKVRVNSFVEATGRTHDHGGSSLTAVLR